jgi:hypothetical protein
VPRAIRKIHIKFFSLSKRIIWMNENITNSRLKKLKVNILYNGRVLPSKSNSSVSKKLTISRIDRERSLN